MSATGEPEHFDDNDKNAMRVAYWTWIGKSQSHIKDELRLKSQSAVSRLLKHAREKKWLVEELNLPITDGELGVAAIGQDGYTSLRRHLKELSINNGVQLTEVHVHHSGEKEADRLKCFGESAARVLINLLGLNVYVCAVSWGRTVEQIVASVERSKLQPRPEMQFIPVAGERWVRDAQRAGISASEAARRLADAFRQHGTEDAEPVLSLQGIPARIPRKLAGKENATVIEDFLNASEAYRKIFSGDGGNGPLIHTMDALISGIGDTASQKAKSDPWFKETRELDEIEPDALQEVAIGNLAGVSFVRNPKSTLTIAGEKRTSDDVVREINGRWLGIQEEHIRACAKRAAAKELPGVMVFAVGPEKAEIVERAMGMVNHLFVDDTLAKRILETEGLLAAT